MHLPKSIIISLIFACIGITTEVVFTSISKLVNTFIADDAIDWALGGKTYLWMFLIYASIPLLFKLFESHIDRYNIFIKALIAVFVIFIVEFAAGGFLEITTGACPWKYTEGFHVFGFIRLDYFPFWYIFALLIITVYQSLNERLQ